MCGIVGIIGSPLPAAGVLERMRDALSHRGPDDAGRWFGRDAALGHRRLAVIDPGPAGHQPMVSDDGRYVLAYNGEIYNDAALRAELGGSWRTHCDTETVLRWLASGRETARLRGMYAIALIDTVDRTLLLARDPLGIKPLYWAGCAGRVVFASEIQALFEHPELSPEPDPVGVSLYLSSVRTGMGRQTLFAGVRAVMPGECLTFRLDDPGATPVSKVVRIESGAGDVLDDEVADRMRESVRVHLRSDVSLCAMLSGGLDSTIIVGEAVRHADELRTYCAASDRDGPGGDAEHAAQVSSLLGTSHSTIGLDERGFTSLWIDTIARTGLPLSTPNQVAIRMIARAMRDQGQRVTLSGEGADELFAGYDGPLRAAANRGPVGGGLWELDAHSWVARELKPALMSGELSRGVGDDSGVIALYESAFAEAAESAGLDGVAAHLRFQRAVNLPVLLERLDSATMLESVEGRTPFADVSVAALAAGMPIERLFDPSGATPAERTKLALRRAFGSVVPSAVLRRDKASFPVPFESWMAAGASLALGTGASGLLFQASMVRAVVEDAARHWHIAWPVLNLVLWADRWWGDGLAQARAASTRGTAESSRFV